MKEEDVESVDQESPEEEEEYRGFEDHPLAKAFFAIWGGIGSALRAQFEDKGGGEGV